MTPITGRPWWQRAIRVPKFGSPAANWRVPSMGSRTQTQSRPAPSAPSSSPMIPCPGCRCSMTRRNAASTVRSRMVTGVPSSLISIPRPFHARRAVSRAHPASVWARSMRSSGITACFALGLPAGRGEWRLRSHVLASPSRPFVLCPIRGAVLAMITPVVAVSPASSLPQRGQTGPAERGSTEEPPGTMAGHPPPETPHRMAADVAGAPPTRVDASMSFVAPHLRK